MSLSTNYITPVVNKSSNAIKVITPAVLSIFNRVIIAIAIFFIGFVIGISLGKIIKKILNDIELNKVIQKVFNVSIDLEQIISKFIEYFIYFVTILIVLNSLGISNIILNIIFIAIVIIVVVSVILALNDFFPNFIASITLKNKKAFEIGDILVYNDIKGKIIDFDLNDVKIINDLGEIVFISNRSLVSGTFKVIKNNKNQKQLNNKK